VVVGETSTGAGVMATQLRCYSSPDPATTDNVGASSTSNNRYRHHKRRPRVEPLRPHDIAVTVKVKLHSYQPAHQGEAGKLSAGQCQGAVWSLVPAGQCRPFRYPQQ